MDSHITEIVVFPLELLPEKDMGEYSYRIIRRVLVKDNIIHETSVYKDIPSQEIRLPTKHRLLHRTCACDMCNTPGTIVQVLISSSLIDRIQHAVSPGTIQIDGYPSNDDTDTWLDLNYIDRSTGCMYPVHLDYKMSHLRSKMMPTLNDMYNPPSFDTHYSYKFILFPYSAHHNVTDEKYGLMILYDMPSIDIMSYMTA